MPWPMGTHVPTFKATAPLCTVTLPTGESVQMYDREGGGAGAAYLWRGLDGVPRKIIEWGYENAWIYTTYDEWELSQMPQDLWVEFAREREAIHRRQGLQWSGVWLEPSNAIASVYQFKATLEDGEKIVRIGTTGTKTTRQGTD